MAIVTSSIAFPSSLSSESRLLGPSLARSSRSSALVVRDPSEDNGRGVSSLLDKTKKEISREDVIKNQEENESEKKPVFGALPSLGSLYPRPEVERRPKTVIGFLSLVVTKAFTKACGKSIAE